MTAVEQLIYDLRNIDMSIFNDEHCKKYLEIEKQQIIDAHDMGYIDGGNHKKVTAEMYFAETYRGKRSDDTPMLDRLKAHLDSITPEQFAKEFDEVQEWFQSEMEDEDGLTPDELIIRDMHKKITSSQIEISDEEIEEASRQINYGGGSEGWIKDAFIKGAKWYREQLKNKL